jgi:uncharacterized membrane protein
MSNAFMAMLFGIIGSVSFQVSKGMQRQGIEVFDTFLYKLKTKNSDSNIPLNHKLLFIYILGLILNNSVIIWVMCANLFAATSYFTSMFGTGLIALMLYSNFILKEPIKRNEYIGVTIVIIGTMVLGIEGIFRPETDMSMINAEIISVFAAAAIPVSFVAFMFSLRSVNTHLIGVAAGTFTGICASMNPLFKGIAQNYDGAARFIPLSMESWIFFLVSFLFATSSFIFTQFGFYKRTRASVQIPIHNSIYIVLPILLQALALPAFGVTIFTLLGSGLVVSGMILMHI